MKKYFLSTVLFFSLFIANAQKISKVTISSNGNNESISIAIENAILNIQNTGKIIEYGTEYFSEKIQSYARLEKYNGREEFYGGYDDKAFQGLVKYIGNTRITYYASYDLPSLAGKIKSIGTLQILYYSDFEDEALKGKIKSIGSSKLDYFTSFENDNLKGKLKTIGNTALNYYSNFDDSAFRGKIKSIGFVTYTYYPSYDKNMAGAMKTGVRQQAINGINFIVN
jgi:hypothetical protein